MWLHSFQSVTYGQGKFAAICFNGVYTSSDTITWERVLSASFRSDIHGVSDMHEIVYGNGVFVAIGNSTGGGSIYSSSDVQTWKNTANTHARGIWGVEFVNGKFVATGSDGSLLESIDGYTWTEITQSITNGPLMTTAYGNNTFIATTSVYADNKLIASTDGITWNPLSHISDGAIRRIKFIDGTFYLICHNSVWISPNGLYWRALLSPGPETNKSNFSDFIYANKRYVLIDGFAIWTSLDAVTWTKQNISSLEYPFYIVAYGNDTFVIAGGIMLPVSWTVV